MYFQLKSPTPRGPKPLTQGSLLVMTIHSLTTSLPSELSKAENLKRLLKKKKKIKKKVLTRLRPMEHGNSQYCVFIEHYQVVVIISNIDQLFAI